MVFEPKHLFYYFYSTQPKCPRRFMVIVDPDCLHTCSMSPCQVVDECVCFLPEILDLLRPKISQRVQKKTYLTGEKKVGNGLAGIRGTRVPNFRVLPKKTAWTLDAQ